MVSSVKKAVTITIVVTRSPYLEVLQQSADYVALPSGPVSVEKDGRIAVLGWLWTHRRPHKIKLQYDSYAFNSYC